MARKYWVNFKIVDPKNGNEVGAGSTGIARDFPITDEKSLEEIGQVILKMLAENGRTGYQVTINSWQKFEEESIVLASSLPQTS